MVRIWKLSQNLALHSLTCPLPLPNMIRVKLKHDKTFLLPPTIRCPPEDLKSFKIDVNRTRCPNRSLSKVNNNQNHEDAPRT